MAKAGSADKMLWVKYIESMCTGVFLEQSPRKLIDVRDSLNELLGSRSAGLHYFEDADAWADLPQKSGGRGWCQA